MSDIQTAIAQGLPFLYTGHFCRLNRHPMTLEVKKGERTKTHLQINAAKGQLIESHLPEEAWKVEQFGEVQGWPIPFGEQKISWQGPGFMLSRPGFGHIPVLFSECVIKEGNNG